jgi:hypothetical protein
MNKAELLQFIELYNLGGNVESVKIVSDGNGLKTNFRTEDKTLVGNVAFTTLKFEAGEYGIHDTAQLKRMLSMLDDTVEISVIKYDGKPISLAVSDKIAESFCMLADLSIIPGTSKVSEPKSYDVEIPISEDFITRFVKACGAVAVKDRPTIFTLMMNKKQQLELVVGYSSLNSNRVRLEVVPVPGKGTVQDMINFNADYFREILSKNRGTSGAIFKVWEEGLGTISFKTAAYEANYYMMKKRVED